MIKSLYVDPARFNCIFLDSDRKPLSFTFKANKFLLEGPFVSNYSGAGGKYFVLDQQYIEYANHYFARNQYNVRSFKADGFNFYQLKNYSRQKDYPAFSKSLVNVRDQGTCQYTGHIGHPRKTRDFQLIDLEHIVPQSKFAEKYSANLYENTCMSLREVNNAKSDTLIDQFLGNWDDIKNKKRFKDIENIRKPEPHYPSLDELVHKYFCGVGHIYPKVSKHVLKSVNLTRLDIRSKPSISNPDSIQTMMKYSF